MTEPPDFTSGVNLPILDRMDYTRNVRGLPPMPRSLRLTILGVRLLPVLTQAGLALSLWTNPATSTLPGGGLAGWIVASYGLTSQAFAAWLLLFAVLSLWWSLTGRWRRMLLLRVGGNIIFTFPLLFYVLCTDWYLLVVAPTISHNSVVLYSALYITQMVLYAKTAGLAIWFDKIRNSQGSNG